MSLPLWFTMFLIGLMFIVVGCNLLILSMMIRAWRQKPLIEQDDDDCAGCGGPSDQAVNGVDVCSSCREELFW